MQSGGGCSGLLCIATTVWCRLLNESHVAPTAVQCHEEIFYGLCGSEGGSGWLQ